MKYAVLKYSTGNIGDEIQSIAAMQFLPRVDYFIDRDKINMCRFSEKTKIILNGWFKDNPEDWPPKDDNLKPLLISMHLNEFLKNSHNLTSEDSLEYYKKNGPVGCRDTRTLEILKNKGINPYFSGCLTLTIENKFKERDNRIYLVDVDKNLINAIPEEFRKDVVILTHLTKDINNKFKIAQDFLDQYAKARLVITSRLHCVLPCLALNTPVILTNKNLRDTRFSGLSRLLEHHETEDMEKILRELDWNNLEKLKRNNPDILEIKNNLIKICKNFIENE